MPAARQRVRSRFPSGRALIEPRAEGDRAPRAARASWTRVELDERLREVGRPWSNSRLRGSRGSPLPRRRGARGLGAAQRRARPAARGARRLRRRRRRRTVSRSRSSSAAASTSGACCAFPAVIEWRSAIGRRARRLRARQRVIDEWWGGRRWRRCSRSSSSCTSATRRSSPRTATGSPASSCGFRSQTFDDEAYVHFVGVDPGRRGCGPRARALRAVLRRVRAADDRPRGHLAGERALGRVPPGARLRGRARRRRLRRPRRSPRPARQASRATC